MEYKKILQITVILISQLIIGSCSTGGKASFSGDVDGEQLVTTRKFAGTFLEYRATVTDDLPRVEVVWIKTSLESIYGKICAEGKRCEFRKGDRLYLTRKHYNPGMVGGRWEYFIENDSAVIYKLTDYQSDKHVSAKTWF
ncbi:MAG TPA: hypothetical protein PL123_04460 [Bacteroidales bacterium]|nr:hypothetical protein [Bacteroidales bacterium]